MADDTDSTSKADPKAKAPKRDPLIRTVSEVAAMSEAEKQDFRSKGGTACSDPVS